jgi:membrane-associated phospholipid phosphatase
MLPAFVFYTILFMTVVVVPAGLILVALLFLEHERRMWRRVTPAIGPIGPIGRMLARAPLALRIGARFPRTLRFLTHRLEPSTPWGLPATLAGALIFAGAWFFLGVLQDLVAKDPLVILDIRLHNTVPLFRTPEMTRFMLLLTEFGGATVLSLFVLGIALLALARGSPRLAATFMLALASTGLTSATFKALIGNARPVDAIISVHEASFPSGHMLSGTVVYGLLAALLLGSPARDGVRAFGTTLLLLVMVGIGLSRLYLGVHWPSDLLGSLALALILLGALLFFLHYSRPIRWIDSFKLPLSIRATLIAGATALFAAAGLAVVLSGREKVVQVESPTATTGALSIETLRASLPHDLPRWSEDVIGGRMEPISLVLIGSPNDIVDAFNRAGWRRADLPTPARILQEGIDAMRDRPEPAGPVTPTFFMDRPQSLAFEKAEADSPSIRRRHHTRLWETPHCLAPACRRIWVATASFDVGIEFAQGLYLVTHRIDPAITSERSSPLS